jgi:ribosomal-protein-alanine N-acetyltransferase
MFQPLETKRLLLRKVKDEDLSFIHHGLSNEKVTQYMLIHYPTLEAAEEQLHYYEDQYASGNGCYWVMEIKTTQQPVGVIGITNIKLDHLRAEMGYWILPEHQQQGFTLEAARTVLSFCFEKLALHRVEADTETENLKSIRVLEKLDFKREGVFRDYEINKGRFIDLARYALLKEEFKP